MRRPVVAVVAVIAVLVAASVATGLALSNGNGSGDKPAAAAPAPKTSSTQPLVAPSSSVSVSTSPAADQSRASAARAKPSVRVTAPAKKQASDKSAKPKLLTYTVKRGDNLTVIAKWFHLHGYQPLYGWNKTVIGSNPDLIYAGTKIVVSTAGMTVKKGH